MKKEKSYYLRTDRENDLYTVYIYISFFKVRGKDSYSWEKFGGNTVMSTFFPRYSR